LLGFRDISNATNERTAIFSLIPRVAVNHKSPLCLSPKSVTYISCLFGNFNSLVFYFITRQKIGGTSLSYFLLKQLPIIPPERYTPSDLKYIIPRILELVYTANDLKPFANDIWRESGIESRESLIKQWEKNHGKSIFSFLSGSPGMGGRDEFSPNVLSNNEDIPQGRNLRNDLTNQESSSINTCEYSGGLREGEPRRIHSISEDSTGVSKRIGNPSNSVSESQINEQSRNQFTAETMRNSGEDAAISNSFSSEQKLTDSRLSTLDSRLSTPDSRLSTPDSRFPLPPFTWNESRRAVIRAELDAKYAQLYGLNRDDLRYILDPSDIYGEDYPGETFRVLKNNEIKKYGEYRTQRLVLDAYDALKV
jgi:hypothetical protein